MNINSQYSKIVNSERWTSFLESTATGLQVNLCLLRTAHEEIAAATVCPICLSDYAKLSKNDVGRVFELTSEGLTELVTEAGEEAVIIKNKGEIPLVVWACSVCPDSGSLSLTDRALIAYKLLKSFYKALSEGFRGGTEAIQLSTLRHMNHIILSLFQGKDDAVERSFDLILSALIIILDAQGSWLELTSAATPQVRYKGDQQVIKDYAGLGLAAHSVELDSSGIQGRLGVIAPGDITQAKEFLPLMAQEVAIVFEIDSLFRLFHRRLIRVLEAIDSGIVLIDKNGTLNYVNHPFELLFGTPSVDIIGGNLDFIKGPWTPYFKTDLSRRVEGKVDMLTLNNRLVCVDWQVSPLIEEGSVQGWVLFVNDRTDYYRWQEAVRTAERLATTTALVGSLAHELRNPLSAAKALLQLTRQKGNTHRSGGYLDLIQRELDRVTRMLNEFLLLGKPADKHEEPIGLAGLIQELTPLLETEADSFGAELIVTIDNEVFVRADPGQITQVIMNLIRNAAEAAGKDGKIFVSMSSKGQQVELTVKDTGNGISPKVKDMLFRPFFTTKERGTGLGLPIVQAIIHNHGGNILVRNAEEGGAVFQVNLPIFSNGAAIHFNVLMVIFDRLIQYPAEQAVSSAGFNVLSVDNLERAICLLQECRPEILIVEKVVLDECGSKNSIRDNLGKTKLIVIGEESDIDDLETAVYLPLPLNYTQLVSKLLQICL